MAVWAAHVSAAALFCALGLARGADRCARAAREALGLGTQSLSRGHRRLSTVEDWHGTQKSKRQGVVSFSAPKPVKQLDCTRCLEDIKHLARKMGKMQSILTILILTGC